jgi:hypothetical protein
VVADGILQVGEGQWRMTKLFEVVAWSEVDGRQQSTVAGSQAERRPGMELLEALWLVA